jgi:DNA polymerase-1
MNVVLLVDGNSLLCRAFYVPRYKDLSFNGKPTGAVFGFFKMLADLKRKYQPSHMMVALDKSRQCWRNTIFPDYKAQRNPTPEDLIPQKSQVRYALDAFNIPWMDSSDLEADDIIASLAASFSLVPSTFIGAVTSDRDLLQIINRATNVLITTKGVSEIVSHKLSNIVELYGCWPNQVPDLKALEGDVSDNIPGCEGIGKKTARTLIAKYNTLEGVITAAQDGHVKGKIGANISSSSDLLRLYKKVATVATQPLPVSLERLELSRANFPMGEAMLRSEFGIVSISFTA